MWQAASKRGPNHLCLLIIMPLCDVLPWKRAGPRSLLLMNRIWQEWWDSTSKIMFLKAVTCILPVLSLVLLVCSDKTSYHVVSCPLDNSRWRTEARGPTAVEVSLEADIPQVEAWDHHSLTDTLIRALWAALSWRTQLSCTWIPNPQSGYNKYLLF